MAFVALPLDAQTAIGEPMKAFVLTVAADNGVEFAHHQKVSRSWMQGSTLLTKPYHS